MVASQKLINFVHASHDSHIVPSSSDVNDNGKGRMTTKPLFFFIYFFIGVGRSSGQISHTPKRRTHFQRKVPTCHFCGKRGHIRPYCNQLPHKPPIRKSSNDYEIETHNDPLNQIFSLMKDITFRLDKLEGNQHPF